jgi:hypothetical protein
MENKLEPHKYIFKIFASILFDELRVTNFEVKRGVILNKKIPNGIKSPKTVEEFEKGVEEFFLFNPSILSQVYFLSAENEFKEFLNNRETIFYFSENNIEISFPEFSCATTEFYYYLITNEAIRTLIGIEYFVSKEKEEEKKISYLQTVLTLISIYITGGVKRIIDEREFLPQVPFWEVDDELAEIHSYTYKVLILALVRFYKEIIYAFRPLVDDLDKSVLELLHRKVDNINSNLLEQEINFGILWLKVKDLFESENFNIEEAFKLLTELYKQKENEIYQEKRILAITCLENQLFLYETKYYKGCNEIIELSSFSFCNPKFDEIKNDYKKKIESHNTGYDRYEEVENLMSQINQVFDGRIQNDSGIENSIPRELLKWLDEKKEFYRNQINTSFKKKPEKGLRKKRGEDEIPSFHYKKYASNYANLTDLKKSLENKGFIKKIDLHKRTFEKIFSGKEISEAVVWEESIEALKYFIILIHREYCVIDNISPYHLAVACKCFKPKDMPSFTRKQLGKAHKPSEDIQILLEEMVQNHLL